MAKKKVVLDTNVLIALYRNRKAVYDYAKTMSIDEVFITHPTYIEFLAGAKVENKRFIKSFLQNFQLLSFDAKSEIASKTLATQNQITGKGKCTDLLIASICIANGMAIVTANVSDFTFTNLEVIKYIV